MHNNKLSHLDLANNPTMVDVHDKPLSYRTATAESRVILPENVMALLQDGDLKSKKGTVFQTAILGGIMAAKRTGELIPLCHPLGLDNCAIAIDVLGNNEILISCTASITAKTGIEMDAMVGASMAALIIYDMCKAMSHDIIIQQTRLLSKTGGKHDFNRNF